MAPMTHVFLMLVGAALLLLTLPLVLELALVTGANFLLPRRPHAKPQASRETEAARPFTLVIVVPAHNEELLVSRTVSSLRASAGAADKIFLIAHNCTDATAARAAATRPIRPCARRDRE